jgi:hypothetical protein
MQQKGAKEAPQWVTITTGNGDDDYDKVEDGSNEEHVDAVERDFKRQARQPTDHLEKLLEVTCPNHAYPIKHKLKECSMMKNYMTTGALAKGKKPVGDPGGMAAAPIPREEAIMPIYDGPIPMSPGVGSSLRAGQSTP